MRVLRLLAVPLAVCPLALFIAGCGGSVSGPSPEVQQQNIDDELKAMENAKQPVRDAKGRPSGI